MTLFQHTLGQLLRGEKTETSRLALPQADGEHIVGREMIQYPMGNKAVMRGTPHGWRLKWQVGRDYAIQPSRWVKSVGQYRIVDIWWQDVRSLSNAQVQAEGFEANYDFIHLWLKMHGENNFEAWRMSIKVLYETVDWNAVPHEALPSHRKWTTIDYADYLKLPRMNDRERQEFYLGKWTPPE